jgi:hypothetical protein
VQGPRCQQGGHRRIGIAEGAFQPGAGWFEGSPEKSRQRQGALLPGPAREQSGGGPAPQLLAQQGEHQFRIVLHLGHRRRVGRACPRAAGLEGLHIAFARGGQHQAATVGQQYAGGGVVVAVFHARLPQGLAQIRVRRAYDEQRVRGGQGIVREARQGELVGANAATVHVLAFEHVHAPPVARQQCGTDQGVDAAAHEQHVKGWGRGIVHAMDVRGSAPNSLSAKRASGTARHPICARVADDNYLERSATTIVSG